MEDYLGTIKHLGLTARIKRLNDALNYGIKDLYRSEGLDIEPSWHLVLLLLKEERELSLLALSQRLRVSQPAVTKAIERMKAKGYVKQFVSEADQRVRMVELTAKSLKAFPKWLRVWDAGRKAIAEMLENNQVFLSAFAAFENEQMTRSFSERAQGFLEPMSTLEI